MKIAASGKTADGAVVFDGAVLFRMKDETGLPPDMAAESIYARGMVIDWLGFVTEAVRKGWPAQRAIREVDYALIDHPSVRPVIVAKLKEQFQ